MTAVQYTAADYLGALQALLPRGRVWPRDSTAVLTQALGGLAPVYERGTEAALELLVDAFPATADGLLPEWESSLGLPDMCSGMPETIQARQAQVLARFTGDGGQSAGYMQRYAAALGFSGAVVSSYTPFRMGQQRMGCQLGGVAWCSAWSITVPAK